jgi:hypothetical protein
MKIPKFLHVQLHVQLQIGGGPGVFIDPYGYDCLWQLQNWHRPRQWTDSKGHVLSTFASQFLIVSHQISQLES